MDPEARKQTVVSLVEVIKNSPDFNVREKVIKVVKTDYKKEAKEMKEDLTNILDKVKFMNINALLSINFHVLGLGGENGCGSIEPKPKPEEQICDKKIMHLSVNRRYQ